MTIYCECIRIVKVIFSLRSVVMFCVSLAWSLIQYAAHFMQQVGEGRRFR
jgi:hypothetical protein